MCICTLSTPLKPALVDEDEVTHSPDRNPAVQGSKLAGDWEILVVYLKRYKDIHARLPVTVASTLLQADSCIEMPLWLVQMFKKSAVSDG
ncbi:hypothetical protein YC2023_099155 [Brassica napus]